MDLIEKNANGMLDAMAACKLLWASALSFGKDDVAWDGHAAVVSNVAINDDVISLYSVSHEEVQAVVPDLLNLLNALEGDNILCVDPAQIASPVLDVLPTEHLTGTTLFLLQAGAHPLIVESADKDCVRIRYSKKLARGIPHLQDLLCRMACHLRAYNGEQGPFTVLFAANDGRGNSSGIDDFEGCVPGAVELLDQSASIADCGEIERFYRQPALPRVPADKDKPSHKPQQSSGASTEPGQNPDEYLLRVASTLESNAYTIRALADATRRRLDDYKESLERVEQAQPNAKAYKTTTHVPKDLPTSARASRSLVLRSAIYIAIGIVFLWLGSRCITQNEDVSAWLMRVADGAFVRAHDFFGLVLGQFGQVGTQISLGFPADSLAGPVRIAGYVLMAIGIIFPVRKILKHNRRLKRYLAFHRSHVDYMTALVAKKQLNDEIEYTQDLEAWSARLVSLEASIDVAKRSLARLERAGSATDDALATHYAAAGRLPKSVRGLCATCTMLDYMHSGRCTRLDGADGAIARYKEDLHAARVDVNPNEATALQPTLRTTARSCDSLAAKVEAQPSEEERHKLIAEQCDKAMASLAQLREGQA